jgi:hypothetical protein
MITACPNSIDPETQDVILAADQAAQGLWPDEGGWLHQSAVLIEAVRAYWRLGLGGGGRGRV